MNTSALFPRDEFELFLKQNLHKDLLRFTTAGSVDDGKSTLIGRLLYDSQTVYEDQLASVKKSRINRSGGAIDFSLITDGLQAEREQGITIDVGYRYFSTAKRKFIIADTPGHEQYTRNMATGASTAELAVILIDATKGILPQTRRHSYIASLLGIPNVLAAINKIDLLDYRQEAFTAIAGEYTRLARELGFALIQCIPISALRGDNVVERSQMMPWYSGPTFLEHLETVTLAQPVTAQATRFSIQYVIRPDASFRGFAGQISSGTIRPGDPLIALPSGEQTRVESIITLDGLLSEAFSPMSVTLELANHIDLSRGDMLVAPDDPPVVSWRFVAMVVWMHTTPLQLGQSYLIKQSGRQMRGKAASIRHRVNISTLQREQAERLHVNDIGAAEFETVGPLFFDPYRSNRTTGSFIIIDLLTNATLGAGMIAEDLSVPQTESPRRADLESPVTALDRHSRNGHFPAIILTHAQPVLAVQLERALFERGFEVFTMAGTKEDSIPAAAVVKTLYAAGFVVLYERLGLGAAEKQEFQAVAGEHFFDLSEASCAAPAAAIQQVLSFADSLRIPGAYLRDRGI
jgi:sulfate adenylyltransferase subunit 1